MANPFIHFLALILPFFFQGVASVTFTFHSKCPFPIWPGVLTSNSAAFPTTGFELQPGATFVASDVPATWSGRIWARQMCSTDASGRFSCLSGDCGSGLVGCNGAGGAPPATLVELTLRGANGKDFYDVSCVDGFNVPVEVAPEGGRQGGCETTACPANINGDCPQELFFAAPDGQVVGCKSACLAFNSDEACCRGAYGTPDKCRPGKHAKFFESECPQAYSFAYDDASGTFTCIKADYRVTFCPRGPFSKEKL